MTTPELEKLRAKLTQAILDIMDDAFASTEPEQARIGLNPPPKVRWGKTDPADYGTPSTVRVDESVLVDRAARRMRGELLDPLVFFEDDDDRQY